MFDCLFEFFVDDYVIVFVYFIDIVEGFKDMWLLGYFVFNGVYFFVFLNLFCNVVVMLDFFIVVLNDCCNEFFVVYVSDLEVFEVFNKLVYVFVGYWVFYLLRGMVNCVNFIWLNMFGDMKFYICFVEFV